MGFDQLCDSSIQHFCIKQLMTQYKAKSRSRTKTAINASHLKKTCSRVLIALVSNNFNPKSPANPRFLYSFESTERRIHSLIILVIENPPW